MARWCVGGALALALTLGSAQGHAQDDSGQSAAAQALFDQARGLMAKGDHAAACPKLEESQRLDPASGTLLNLGDCYEKLGRTATAWSRFLEAEATARARGHVEGSRVARDRANALATRVPQLVIDVTAAERTLGLTIQRNHMAVGAAQWGAPIPVDPGRHRITALAPGYAPFETEIVIAPTAVTSSVNIPALVLLPERREPQPPLAADERPVVAPASVAPRDSSTFARSSQHFAGLAIGGFGVAALGTGLVLGLLAKSQYDAANCPGNGCVSNAEGRERDAAHSKADAATVAFAVGVAAVAGGATLWLLAPRPAASARMARAASARRSAPWLGVRASPNGLWLEGSL